MNEIDMLKLFKLLINYIPNKYRLYKYIKHPGVNHQVNGRLIVFKYSKVTQYSKNWDDITMNARGIVFNKLTGEVVARPFSKFFNYEEITNSDYIPEKYKPSMMAPFTCLEKLDGSLGVVYFYKGEWHVNTGGSFTSEQAIWGQEWFDNNVDTTMMYHDATYCFEIIYPKNRIVVDYGNKKSMVLIGIIDTQSGNEYSYEVIKQQSYFMGTEFATRYEFNTLSEMLIARESLSLNEEGYVITCNDGSKFKLKGEEYCRVHRMVSHMTPLDFWRAIDIDTFTIPVEYISTLPEELEDVVQCLKEVTEAIHQNELHRLFELSNNIPHIEDSRERYNYIKENFPDDLHSLLAIMNHKLKGSNINSLRENIHRKVRPTKNDFSEVNVPSELMDRLNRIQDN